jgi:hypothetical protein
MPSSNDVNNMRFELGKLHTYINKRASVMDLERRSRAANYYYLVYNKLQCLSAINNIN